MNKLLIYFIIIFNCCNISASEFVDLAEEIRIPVPDNWQVAGDSRQFPFQIINKDQSAELLIYKSAISKNETVKNNSELKEAVDIIINDIILTLPEAKLLSTTGKIDDNRAIFSLDFTSTDTATTGKIFHRLNGYLYEHPNGEQILFTLWGKTSSESKDVLHNEILLMQNNFSYYGDSNKILFQAEQEVDWRLFLLIIVIIVSVLIFFKKFKSTDTVQFSEDSHFWRCSCGRQNHNSHDSCKRCGQKEKIKESV